MSPSLPYEVMVEEEGVRYTFAELTTPIGNGRTEATAMSLPLSWTGVRVIRSIFRCNQFDGKVELSRQRENQHIILLPRPSSPC